MSKLIGVVVATFIIAVAVSVSCLWIVNYANGDKLTRSFFKQPVDHQVVEFSHYSFDDQYALYIYGQQHREPPAGYLTELLARRGESAIGPLEAKLLNAHADLTIRDTLLVFRDMSALRVYDVGSDPQLLRTLGLAADRIRDPYWRDMCESWVREIRNTQFPKGMR
jgi:hypothetical protein